jgi:aspartate/methionine/tyrosine aminotransferase
MGVIFVVDEAEKRGFVNGHPDWCNLGQGQPEIGELPGAPARLSSVELAPGDHAYGPVHGVEELRAKVAEHYNRLFRTGGRSQYGPQHVAIAQGGRLALSRALAGLGEVTVGYQLPDYTAYEDMLGLHLARLTPYPVRTSSKNGFLLTHQQFCAAIAEAGLGAFLLSNPCNPTGRTLYPPQLAAMLEVARGADCTLLLDEFYSHFVYAADQVGDWHAGSGPISIASVVEDVDRDPVLIFDGLTKNYRYPGWRLGWVLGPPEVIATMSRVASSLDGGPSRLAQRAAMSVLEPAVADQETDAVRTAFAAKRNVMVRELSRMGVRFAGEPDSTFYVWGDLSDLPEPLNDAMSFFWQALDRKVMTVPGAFFDVNPGRRRRDGSAYQRWMRFSFGPSMDNLVLGLSRLRAMVDEHR